MPESFEQDITSSMVPLYGTDQEESPLDYEGPLDTMVRTIENCVEAIKHRTSAVLNKINKFTGW